MSELALLLRRYVTKEQSSTLAEPGQRSEVTEVFKFVRLCLPDEWLSWMRPRVIRILERQVKRVLYHSRVVH
jgi:predicted protein tyrosine phosphatase